MTNKILSFSVEGIEELEYLDSSQFSLLSVDCFATGKSAHDTFVTEETLRRTAKTILLKPFVFAIDKRFDDLGTHEKSGFDGEIAGGFVPHNTPIIFKTLDDGRIMMNCQVLIWNRYSGDLLKYFSRDGGKKSVSVEIEVSNSRVDEKSGLTELIDFCYNAITGLGDLVRPAIPNAEAVLQFSADFNKAKEEYLFASRYDDIDFTIPTSIKNSAKKALESKNGSSVALAMGRFLSSKEKITPERVRQIHKYFTSKSFNSEDSAKNGLYGGKQSIKWAAEIVALLDEADKKKLSYFGEEISRDVSSNNSSEMEEIKMAKEQEEDIKKEEMAETPKEETPAEDENKEAPEKEKDEQEKGEEKKFSLDAYVDVPAMLAFLESETETNEEMAEKVKMAADELKKEGDFSEEKFGAVVAGMYAKMCKMSARMAKMAEDSKVYMAENEELKKFKADIEKERKEFAVDSFLKELNTKVVVPDGKLDEMKASSDKFTFAELDGWKNECKAISFDFAVRKKEEDKQEKEIIVYALPFSEPISNTDDVWAGK